MQICPRTCMPHPVVLRPAVTRGTGRSRCSGGPRAPKARRGSKSPAATRIATSCPRHLRERTGNIAQRAISLQLDGWNSGCPGHRPSTLAAETFDQCPPCRVAPPLYPAPDLDEREPERRGMVFPSLPFPSLPVG